MRKAEAFKAITFPFFVYYLLHLYFPQVGIILCWVFFVFCFLDFGPHWVFVAAHGLSLTAVSGGYSLLQCSGSRCMGFSSYGMQAQ